MPSHKTLIRTYARDVFNRYQESLDVYTSFAEVQDLIDGTASKWRLRRAKRLYQLWEAVVNKYDGYFD